MISNFRCCVVFSIFLVACSNILSAISTKHDVENVRDIGSDDNDIETNFGKHLENSIKEVQNDMTVDALKVICRMLPCSDWSAWTACGSLVGRRGSRSRTRNCGFDVIEACKQNMIGIDNETTPCMINIPWCPLDYNYTRHGFCVRLYNSLFKSWYDAQIQCESDGGHLLNIDSETKSADINEVFENVEILSVYAWVDGIKQRYDGKWEFRSGLKTPKFSNWYKDHPREERFPTCKCVIRSGMEENFEWRSSYVCENRENFICEIKRK